MMSSNNKKLRTGAESDLDTDQMRVVEAVRSGRNVFFTGPAGTGKSHTIQHIAKSGDPSISLTALTGVASILIEGTTLHSFFGVGLAQGSKEDVWDDMSDFGKQRVRRCRMLIVDEVSMMSATLLEKLDLCARRARRELHKAFGGIQIVFVGDFKQLPPVSRDTHEKFCFESPVWQELDFVHVMLRINHRQTDPVLVNGLAKMRDGELDPEFLIRVSAPKDRSGPIKATRLVGTNAQVDKINETELDKLTSPLVEYHAEEATYVREDVLKNVMAPKHLKLKVGAQVMHMFNDSETGLRNGTRGAVVDFQDGMPVVLFMGFSMPITVQKHRFEIKREKRLIAYRTCYPLRLAWSCTIHKSQSQTIDLVDVDCKGMFAASQAYVALSRARTLEGLFVENLDPGCVWCDSRVEAFYDSDIFN